MVKSKVLRGITSVALVLSSLAPGCARSSPAQSVELHEDYTAKPNGRHPPTFDSGQQAVLTYAPEPAATPTILGGRSIIAYSGKGKGAGYATGQLNASAAFIEADWDFSSTGSSDGSVLALGLYASPLPSGDLGDLPVPNSPAHVIFARDHFEYGVWKNDDLTVIASVPYGRTFTTETQHVAVFVRKDLGQAWVLAPTGIVYGPFTHQSIGDTAAPYVTAEQFYLNSDTDGRVEIQKWRATSEHVEVPQSGN